MASSEWITFVDGDDWIERDFCEHFMNRIKSCSNIADVYFYSGFRNFPNKEVIGMPHFEDGKDSQIIVNVNFAGEMLYDSFGEKWE